MKSLNQFQGYQQVFRDAKVLPPFFQTNLVDPARVVKVFENDPQAEIRIFYYQYLKLCFELQNVNYDMYIRKIEEIINNIDFQFIFYSSDDPSIFNDTQSKSLIMEFFGVLGEGNTNVLQCLTKYPLMDKIFVHFFRSLMILSSVTDSLDSYIDRDTLLNFLCKTFEVEAEVHGECIRYTETDIFIYQLNHQAVYMAYMDYENYNNSAQEPPQVSYGQAPTSNAPISTFSQSETANLSALSDINRKQNLAKDSYIADEFVDFTSNASALTSKAKNILKSSESELQQYKIQPARQVNKNTKQFSKQSNPQPKLEPARNLNSNNIVETKSIPYSSNFSSTFKSQVKTDSFQPPLLHPLAHTTKTVQIDSNNPQYNTQSNFQSYDKPVFSQTAPYQAVPTKDSTYNQKPTQQIQSQKYTVQSKVTKNDLIYNPKFDNSFNIANYLNPKVEQTKDIKSMTTYGTGKKKPFGLNISEEFTNSQVSKYMVEPHRSNVENMKVRQRNFRNSLVNSIK